MAATALNLNQSKSFHDFFCTVIYFTLQVVSAQDQLLEYSEHDFFF